MNTLKKLAAMLLCVCMLFTFAACHPKNEVALTIDDVKITSALYMYALITADGEARSKVDETKEDASAEVDYYKEKVDDKKFEVWVKDRAIELCKDLAANEIKFKEAKLSLTKEQKDEVKQYVDYYWSYYGYQALYETNGVSKETFSRAFESSYYLNEYFLSIYGEKGTNPVAKDEIIKTMDENFATANVLSVSLAELKDEEKADAEKKFNGYLDRLKKGEEFGKIYNEYYEIKETEEEKTEETKDEKAPKDEFATILGSDKTDYKNDNFKTVKEMKMGEIKLVKTESEIAILIRGDMMADEYWVESLTTPTLNLIKGEEFQKTMADFTKKLKVEKNSYAINRFKVKNIVYPTAAQ